MKKLLAAFLVLGLVLYLGCAQETKKGPGKGGTTPSTAKDKDKKPSEAKPAPGVDKPTAKPEATAPKEEKKADKPEKEEKKPDKPATPPPGKAGDEKPK
jgi:hypothetical protein